MAGSRVRRARLDRAVDGWRSSLRTVSRSTASRSLVVNAATVASASSQRVEERGAASVEAATPTGDENGSTPVVSVTTAMKTPTSSPVTIAYDRVRLIRRSISYMRNEGKPRATPFRDRYGPPAGRITCGREADAGPRAPAVRRGVVPRDRRRVVRRRLGCGPSDRQDRARGLDDRPDARGRRRSWRTRLRRGAAVRDLRARRRGGCAA